MPMDVAGDSPSPNEAVAGDEPSSDEIQQQQPVGRRCASKRPFMIYFLYASTIGWWTHLYPSDDNSFAGSVLVGVVCAQKTFRPASEQNSHAYSDWMRSAASLSRGACHGFIAYSVGSVGLEMPPRTTVVESSCVPRGVTRALSPYPRGEFLTWWMYPEILEYKNSQEEGKRRKGCPHFCAHKSRNLCGNDHANSACQLRGLHHIGFAPSRFA